AFDTFSTLATLNAKDIGLLCKKTQCYKILKLDPDQASNLFDQTEGQHISSAVSYTTKAHAHPSNISAPSQLLQYSRTNNDSPLHLNSESMADVRRGKRHAFPPLLSSISATRTGSPSPATALPHSTSPTVSVLSPTSQPTSPLASERASSSRTTPNSSAPQSPSFATASSDNSTSLTSVQRPSPSGSCLVDPPTPLFSNSREDSAESEPQHVSNAADQQNNTLAPGPSMKYLQALSIMTPMFSSAMSQTTLSEVIRTGDLLVRDDAVSFLRDQILLWTGMWDPSDFRAPSSEDSIADHFVKISHSISVLEGRTHIDLRMLLHRILQYQYYLRIVDEIEKSGIQKQPGVGAATYAIEFLLQRLYPNDWGLVEKKERRKQLLHRQNRLGKRLTRLSGYFGLGFLLLASQEAMGHRVVRHMVKNLPLVDMEPFVESILPDVQRLLNTRRELMPLSTFARFDQEVHHVELLEVLSEEPRPHWQGRTPRPRSIEVNLVSSRKRLRLSS
ncbi:hypothetical protein DL98DRAFT_610543, partial [Cadophora sp. DSE1049]